MGTARSQEVGGVCVFVRGGGGEAGGEGAGGGG